MLENLTVIYRSSANGGRGWGEVSVAHRCRFLPRTEAAAVTGVIRYLIREKPEIAIIFGYSRPVFLAAHVVARFRRIRRLIRVDISKEKLEVEPWWKVVVRSILLRAAVLPGACVLAIGTSNLEYWKRFGASRLELLPYTHPTAPVGDPLQRAVLRKRFGVDESACLFLFVGRLSLEKGILLLLHAFTDANFDVGVHLLIVGEGALEADVTRAVGTDACITAVGAIPQADLGHYYVAADVVVVPSLQESWGLVVNEATANGRPIVASSAVAAANDLVSEANGLRYDATDPTALAGALCAAASLTRAGWHPPRRPEPPADEVAACFARAVRNVYDGPA